MAACDSNAYLLSMTTSDEGNLSKSRAPKPSYITLPALLKPYPTLLDFLDQRFPNVGREVWQRRLHDGDICDEHGVPVDMFTPFRVNARLRYYREVENEPRIPFFEDILYENDDILLADKPHFLPVTPSGSYVNECLLHRLVLRTGHRDLVPVHRLDRETAGLVLFSKQKASREAYFSLFREGRIEKEYQAIASLPQDCKYKQWMVESRIERSSHWLVFENVPGEINARSRIELRERHDSLGLFALFPMTGKTHQLRLHMQKIGSPILGDKFYPELLPKPACPDYTQPLQLLATRLAFQDPVTGRKHVFQTQRGLRSWEDIASSL